MSGLEIFGAIGTAITVVEGIIVTKSYLDDVRHAKTEKMACAQQMDAVRDIIVKLQTTTSTNAVSPQANPLTPFFTKVNDILKVMGKKLDSGRWIWKFAKKDITRLWVELDRMKSFIALELVAQTSTHADEITKYCEAHAADLQRIIAELREVRSDTTVVRNRVEDRELRELRAHLADRPRYTIHEELNTMSERVPKHPQTQVPLGGDWLLESEEMWEWGQQPSDHRTFVLTGPAGSGKTLLSVIVARTLKQAGAICLPVFIRSERDMTAKSVIQLLWAAVLEFMDTYPGDLLQLDLQQLIEKLDHTLLTFSQPIYIVLDALDELKEPQRSEVLQILRSLSTARVFITSRPGSIAWNSSHLVFGITASNSEALESYVHAELQRLPSTRRPNETQCARIIKASNGLFLLASHHLDTVNQCRCRADLHAVIEGLPTSPDDYYSSTLQRIRRLHQKHRGYLDAAMASLLWVLKAKRPLTADEFPAAVACIVNDLAEENVGDYLWDANELVQLCEGLICIQNGKVTFTHLTVQEFFHRHGTSALLDSTSNSDKFSNTVPCLGTGCVNYLKGKHNPYLIWQFKNRSTQSHEEQHGFLGYSLKHWSNHLSARASLPSAINSLAASQFAFVEATKARMKPLKLPLDTLGLTVQDLELLRAPHLAASLEPMLADFFYEYTSAPYFEGEEIWVTPFHIVCCCGDIKLVKYILLKEPRTALTFTTKDGLHSLWPPLFAAEMRIRQVILALLDYPSFPVNIGDVEGLTLLHQACHMKHSDLLKKVLKTGDVDPNPLDMSGQSPIDIASINGWLEGVNILLARLPTDLDLSNTLCTALNGYYHEGFHEIIQCLLDRIPSHIDLSRPLHVALKTRRKEVILLLLERIPSEVDLSAFIISSCVSGHKEVVNAILQRIPLQPDLVPSLEAACEGGYVGVVGMLLERIPVSTNLSPSLKAACVRGHVGVVGMLLEHIPLSTDLSLSLKFACVFGHKKVINLLLQHNPLSIDLAPSLKDACERGNVGVVGMLLERIPSSTDLSPSLKAAFVRGHVGVVGMLLEHIPLSTDLSLFLESACVFGHKKMINLLLQHNPLSMDLAPALKDACERGNVGVVGLLLERIPLSADLTPYLKAADARGNKKVVNLLQRIPLPMDLTIRRRERTSWMQRFRTRSISE